MVEGLVLNLGGAFKVPPRFKFAVMCSGPSSGIAILRV